MKEHRTRAWYDDEIVRVEAEMRALRLRIDKESTQERSRVLNRWMDDLDSYAERLYVERARLR